MATPAAILNILVQTDGMTTTQRQIRNLDKDLDKVDKTSGKTTSSIKKVASVVGGVVAFDTLRRGVAGAIGEFEEARKVGAQTSNVIKTTGGAANVTAKQVATLASSISKKVGIDDEAIQSGANLLLTFKNVSNEVGRGNKIFDRATKAAVDLSAAGFGDLTSTSKQLGKALNDPLKGLSALSRSGVTFTAQQQENIKSLVEQGKTLKAQKIIMKEVESQVKGSAAAQATSFDHLKVTIGNLAEAAGAVLVPAFDKAARFLTTLLNQMIEGKSTGGAIISVFKGIGDTAGFVITQISALVGWLKQNETVAIALGAALGVILTAFAGFKIVALVQAAIVGLSGAMAALNAVILANPIGLIVIALAALAAGVVVAYKESETFRKIVDATWEAIKPVAAWIAGAFVNAFKWLAQAVKDTWNAIRNTTRTLWDWFGPYLTGVFTVVKTAVTTYFNIYKTLITTAWQVIKTVTTTLWDAIGIVLDLAWAAIKTAAHVAWAVIREAILDPIRAARDRLAAIWDAIKEAAGDAWKALKSGAATFAEGLKDTIVKAFKGAVDLVVGFVNKIIEVVNNIPGVNIAKIKGLAQGGMFGQSDAAQGFARGGAFARTGGIVGSPITLMGEEAPRHPEFVIPTNPAHRKRARNLLGLAASAIGFAKGGRYDRDYGQGNPATIPFDAAAMLAEAAGLPGITYAQIAIGESGLRPGAVSSDGGYGLWQMTPRVQSAATRATWAKIGTFFNPWNNAQQAKVLAGAGTGVSNYYGTSHVTDWNKHYTGNIDDYVPSAFANTPSLNPADLIGKLPGVGDLPGWLQGMGKHVIDKAIEFIKDKLGGILGRSVPGWGALDRLAESFGVGISSTYRGNGTSSYHDMLMGTSGRARATDYSNGTAPTPEMMQLAQAIVRQYGAQMKELFYSPLGYSIKNGQKMPGMIVGGPLGTPGNHYNHVHAAFARGGKYGIPYVGAYANGGVVPQTGMALVHQGETVVPAGGGIVLNAVIDLGEGIRQRVRLEFDRQGRQLSGAYLAGRSG